ncbi:hypothetical protein TNCV_1124771 [Trichonephila clavipes]|uniref:Uncharacterized protein n=1 Tax=Trichonephila clavipes TaxID=2585209 RepID=A0A8X6SMB3_TRICX|nr:hypothetical protein TNCV_1124771 [Trichonephila clavipes]
MQSKGCIRLDAGCKGHSLQDGCTLFARKFFFYTQQRYDQTEEPLPTYVAVHLMASSYSMQMSRLYGDLARPFWRKYYLFGIDSITGNTICACHL